MPIQQMLLGIGAKKKTYIDDVFSTYVYKGTGAAHSINNGIDLSGEGGMVWAKNRGTGNDHNIVDTIRGTSKYLISDTNAAEQTEAGNGSTVGRLSSFNNNGFSLGATVYDHTWNNDGNNYATWSFRRAKGFFDIVTYTGDGTASKTISHSLGSIPGVIIARRTDSWGTWVVYHKNLGNDKVLYLNDTDAEATNMDQFDKTDPTASSFKVEATGTGASDLNVDGASYIAYLFAGGESPAATARSVDFNGSGYLALGATYASNMSPASGDFCIEAWIKPHAWGHNDGHYMVDTGGPQFAAEPADSRYVFKKQGGSTILEASLPEINQWTHVAVTRSGTSLKMFYNGLEVDSATDSTDFTGTASTYIGAGQDYMDGEISNLRFVKGSAVYTSSFRPSTKPLTNITNTVLLCCNNSTDTGSTVTPGTILDGGGSTASADSPFDDPAALTFGENGDQGIIKCGSYKGNGSSTGPEINIGWEPQWILLKNTNLGTEQWFIFDSMRGILSSGNDSPLEASRNVTEHAASWNLIDLTPTGFKITNSDDKVNVNNGTYIYVAIRRPDGYCGKPPELGTGVFAMDTGNAAGTITPAFDSGFPVDFGFYKTVASNVDWISGTRLTGTKYMKPNEIDAETTSSDMIWDVNTGWQSWSGGTGVQAWMFKRHAGFDVVAYKGNGVQGRDIPHSLGVSPNMMWVKNRTRTAGGGADWNVYVSGITHLSVNGSDPDNYGNNPAALKLNDTDGAGFSGSGNWDHTHPTSTHFRVGDTYSTNQNGEQMIAMLFASVEKISKVGSYTGDGTTSHDITTGFQPRLIIIKQVSSGTGRWFIFDSQRGLGSGSDPFLFLHSDDDQESYDTFNTSSTGFTLKRNWPDINGNGNKFIYYAHA